MPSNQPFQTTHFGPYSYAALCHSLPSPTDKSAGGSIVACKGNRSQEAAAMHVGCHPGDCITIVNACHKNKKTCWIMGRKIMGVETEPKFDLRCLVIKQMHTHAKKDGRPQGQQNTFSGIKLEFLESYKDWFIDSTDHGAFYTLVAKAFIQRFGYNLAIEDNPEPDDDDNNHTPNNIDPLLPGDEQNLESDRQNGFYHELREKLGCWYQYRYTARSTNQSYVNNTISCIMSTSLSCPRKKTAIGTYGDLHKIKLKSTFDPLWESIKNSVKPQEQLQMWNEHVLPSFADTMYEWLGANIVILAIMPLGASNGEIIMKLVQSDMSKGMTKKLLPQLNPEGWGKLQDMMLEYGKAYFCEKRRGRGNASEFVDKPDDAANIQHLIRDSGTRGSCINPPPSTPLLGTIILQVPPPLASSLAQECPQVPSKTTPLPTNLSLGLPDGNKNEAVGDGGKGDGK
ncbi:hypothetical protein L208DRAFT_1376799 [Tricholoma matsutake]|nr:hypothetical protein L208DRAFT_1376799 [Tricholoma matsutake 945]